MHTPTRGALPWLALITIWTVWGSTYLAMNLAVETIPPFFTTAIRFNPLAYQVNALRGMLLHGTFSLTSLIMIVLTVAVLPVAIRSVSHGDAQQSGWMLMRVQYVLHRQQTKLVFPIYKKAETH